MRGLVSLRCRSEIKRAVTGCRTLLLGAWDDLGGLYDDGLQGHVAMASSATGFNCLDLVYHVHALGHLAKYGITPALHTLAAVVEEVIVLDVDKKLGAGGVGVLGPGHGNGSRDIFEAVIGLIANRGAGGLLLHILGKSTALDHEVINDPVENGAVVVAAFDVFDKVCRGGGGLLGIQLQGDIAKIGVQDNDDDGCSHGIPQLIEKNAVTCCL